MDIADMRSTSVFGTTHLIMYCHNNFSVKKFFIWNGICSFSVAQIECITFGVRVT